MVRGLQPGKGACEKLNVTRKYPEELLTAKVAFAPREPGTPHEFVMVTFVTVQVPVTGAPLLFVGTHVAATGGGVGGVQVGTNTQPSIFTTIFDTAAPE